MGLILLGLGSNLGDREQNIYQAIDEISHRAGKLQDFSSLYETEPRYFEEQPDFLNMVIKIQSKLTPGQLMSTCLKIEKDLGRQRNKYQNRAREIDIDMLFYDDKILDSKDLKLPHPRLSERRFVLEPLNEIVPQFKDPITEKTIDNLLKECPDKSRITLYKKRNELEIKLDTA
ncbi:MAG TPA: 2-amino-4-hydroxy-6-hydroxymethyldihydropteridine diphosphokinase [bacterium]|nr:2-amino-4-hydroxy-6-hydroxymethyldihydropteridine diphosphokinase [bacterium]